MRRLALLALPLALVSCGGAGPTDGDNRDAHMDFVCGDVIDWAKDYESQVVAEGTSLETWTHTFPRKDGGRAVVQQVRASTHDGLKWTDADCDA